ncbi:SpvB/TcaC N-terminal domain-containing protein [Methanolobus psychrotolerans]|uniref:SpvB/TcaC N-terminal domain-containing protein n=1 Tax=Methanolobus psychrotolerans TaxID=1874706 RepID=UPI00101AD7FE|nr:SpvB/TcaC N-terminal domain-containing protein [Methanolobus psychrotolerans]
MVQKSGRLIQKLIAVFIIIILLTPNVYCLENIDSSESDSTDNSHTDSSSSNEKSVDSVDMEYASEIILESESENIEAEISQIETLISSISVPTEDPGFLVESATSRTYPKIESENDYSDTSLFTGSFVYTYPIETIKGRAGLEPKVDLTYSSSLGLKGTHGSFGMGWSLNDNCIIRDTRYTTENTNDDEFILVLDGSNYELVYVEEEGSYHTKIESFLNITKTTTNTNSFGNYWIVKTTDGTNYRFGYNNISEQRNSINSRNYVSKWWLDQIEDVNGNQIK